MYLHINIEFYGGLSAILKHNISSPVFILRDVTRFVGFSRRLVQKVVSLVFEPQVYGGFWYVTNNCNSNHSNFHRYFSLLKYDRACIAEQ